jgi:acetyl esterase/lipase
VYEYGRARAQNAELLLPEGTPRGVVLLVHGGYWQAGYDRTLEDAVAADLVAGGWAVWNLDYRAVGDGGGWPMTYADVAAGADYLAVAAREHNLTLDTLVAVGHSAGGALAGWLAARPQLPAGAVGAAPAVRVTALCTQAGVNDLAAGSRDDLGGGAVNSVIGGPPDRYSERYAVADTSQHLPLGIPLLVVTGAEDVVVPVYQSRDFAAAAAKAGDDVQLKVVAGEGHFEHLDPGTGVWRELRTWLDALA